MRTEAKLAGSRRGLFEPREWEWPEAKTMPLRELLAEVVSKVVMLARDSEIKDRRSSSNWCSAGRSC